MTNNKVDDAQQAMSKNAMKSLCTPYRLNYHVMAMSGWINDPNGLIQYKGKYHAFFQLHPYSPEWGPMHWGHVVSDDLVHWRHLPVALAPDQSYETGCFSGSAVDNDGELTLVYTAHNDDRRPKELQCIATSTDGVHFEKAVQNPVIGELPADAGEDFRDPKVWRENGRWKMVVGSGKDGRGRALCYESDDLRRWRYLGVLCESDGTQGEIWECPDFFFLNDRAHGGAHVLMTSPMGMPGHKAVFMTGSYDRVFNRFEPQHLREADYGDSFYAPQTFEDESGRRILIGWMDMWNRCYPTQKEQWAGALTLPREVKMVDGHICTPPVRETELLRVRQLIDSSFTLIHNSANNIGEIFGESIEIKCILLFDKTECSRFCMKLRASEDGSELTLITFDRATNTVTVDKTRSGINTWGSGAAGSGAAGNGTANSGAVNSGVSSVKLRHNPANLLSLHVFIDKCSLELFINDGEAVITERIYPSPGSVRCDITAMGGECTVKNISAWALENIWMHLDMCKAAFLCL